MFSRFTSHSSGNMTTHAIQTNYQSIRQQISQAAHRAGRSPDEITLVAITKTWPAATVTAAYRAGIRQVGENRVEEMVPKQAEVATLLAASSELTWHFVGALQSRKTHEVADHADYFHALDRLKIARLLSKRLVENGRILPCFVQVNVSGEGSKAGFDADHWEEDARQRQQLLDALRQMAQLPGLELIGLMTMAPWQVEEAIIRRVFRRTRTLRDWLQTQLPNLDLSRLSMGMTDDFAIAIEEGSTHVRIGRALFGERQYG
jgi:PLP dependent protein